MTLWRFKTFQNLFQIFSKFIRNLFQIFSKICGGGMFSNFKCTSFTTIAEMKTPALVNANSKCFKFQICALIKNYRKCSETWSMETLNLSKFKCAVCVLLKNYRNIWDFWTYSTWWNFGPIWVGALLGRCKNGNFEPPKIQKKILCYKNQPNEAQSWPRLLDLGSLSWGIRHMSA